MKNIVCILIIIFVICINKIAYSQIAKVVDRTSYDYVEIDGRKKGRFYQRLKEKYAEKQSLLFCISGRGEEDISVLSLDSLRIRFYAAMKKNDEPLGSCGHKITLDTLGFLNIMRILTMEGTNKVSNSLVSTTPCYYPSLYYLPSKREIEKLADLFTPEGKNLIETAVTQTLHTSILMDSLWDNLQNNIDMRAKERKHFFYREIILTNTPNQLDRDWTYQYAAEMPPIYAYFYFTKNGLLIDNNTMSTNQLRGDGVADLSTLIPYSELTPYVLPAFKKDFEKLAHAFDIKAGNEYKIRSDKAYFREGRLAKIGCLTNQFVLKNTICKSRKECLDWIYCECEDSQGVIIEGWINRRDVSKINPK